MAFRRWVTDFERSELVAAFADPGQAALSNVIKEYIEFEEYAKKVCQTIALSVGGLLFSQFECSQSLLQVPVAHMILLVAYMGSLVLFLSRIASGRLPPTKPFKL